MGVSGSSIPDGTANDLVTRRKAIYEWAQGDPMLLSARCAKAEAELERLLAAALTSPQEDDPDA